MGAGKRCLRVFDDGTQCPNEGWCPLHGDVDRYEAPVTPVGILTSEMLAEGGW